MRTSRRPALSTSSVRLPWGGAGARVRGARRGVTLVEVLIVIALMGILAGSIFFGGGMLGGARERGATSLLIAAVRKGIAHANASGHPVRLALDLDQNHIQLEEASSSKVVRDNPNTVDLRAHLKRLERQVRRDAEQTLDGDASVGPSFRPVPLLGGDDPAAGRDLGAGVKFRLVQTDRDPDPITAGKAYLYFWPGGVTEHAVIQLGSGASSDDGLTVRVSALTGRASVEKGRGALPEPRRDGEFSEREEW